MSDGRDSEQDRDGGEEAVTALVGEQLRAARAEVFRAYLQAQDKARALAGDEDDARRAAAGQRFQRRRGS
ncbi:MAG TPA: hypothetical protein VNT55_12160 [Baekduia sp.]|nr:hypothetical protein [Baekduia sp.]